MEIFSSFYSWGTQGMQTINPVLCFAPGCLTCLPKNLPAALLAPWKCKCMRPESPPLHTAPEMSLLAQQQQWEIQHITRAWINSKSLMLLATIKHSCAQVSKACQVLQLGQPSHTFTTEAWSCQCRNWRWCEIQQCPVCSYLILWALCDFLGLFLKLYSLNISCCSTACQLTSQEEFLNLYKLIIPPTHRWFLQQAWTICSTTN